jgi:hypothetical protein
LGNPTIFDSAKKTGEKPKKNNFFIKVNITEILHLCLYTIENSRKS